MKKYLLVALSVLALSGCATKEAQKVAEEFIEETKEMNITDNSKISEALKKELKENKMNMLQGALEVLEIEDAISLDDAKEYLTFSENLTSLQSLMDYNVLDVKLSDDKKTAEVIANIEYVNIGDEFKKVIDDTLDRSIIKVYNFEEVTGEGFVNNVIDEMNVYIKELDRENLKLSKAEGTVAKVKKEGDDWKISEVDDKTINALTLGMQSKIDKELKSKLEEVKDNMAFLKVEANFNAILDSVENKIKEENGLSLSNFTEHELKQELSKELSKKVKKAVIITDKSSKQNGIYYVTRENGEIKVEVSLDGQKYSTTRKIEVK